MDTSTVAKEIENIRRILDEHFRDDKENEKQVASRLAILETLTLGYNERFKAVQGDQEGIRRDVDGIKKFQWLLAGGISVLVGIPSWLTVVLHFWK